MSEFEQLVEDHNKLTYSNNVMMVAQQRQTRLRSAVTYKGGLTGEAKSVADLLGSKEYMRPGPRLRRNPENPTERSRRWLVRPDPILDGEYIDDEDKWDSAMDPTGYLAANQVMAVERGVHDTILGISKQPDGTFAVDGGGILGTAVSGKRMGTTSALPSGNIIPHGSTGLTLDKLRTAKKTLKQNEFGMDDDDPFYCAISPEEEDDLIGIAAATGSNLNAFSLEQLRTGKATMLMGINWIMTNRLPLDASGDRLCPIWTKRNIVLGFWEEVNGKVWNDSSAQNLPYARTRAVCEAVRIEDAGVIVITCT